jgi:two-component system NtrC family sensor kinase
MREIEPIRGDARPWWRLSHRLSAKLIALLLVGLLATFATLGYLNVRIHRQHLEVATLASAERVSDVIKRSTSQHMLRNDREALYQIIATMADEPGMVRVRIFDKEGHISFSTDRNEIGGNVDKKGEACYGCHAQSQPLARLSRPDRFRIYRANGERVLGVVNPIENRPECSSAPCHAHPASQQILGVLDTNLSLARADASLAEGSRRMLAYTLFAMIVIALLSGVFVWRVVGRPVRALKTGTERLAHGKLGYQIKVDSDDELGELANSFNQMSLQLQAANKEVVDWTRTLEDRVEQKTRELKRAHEHALHTEKMASIGKMAAVVAHEINNPLSGILTYAKLVGKWLDRGDESPQKREETRQCLDLIVAESRRCGDLVKNLLTFSRTAPMNLQAADLNEVVDRCVHLVQHQLELAGIQLQLELDPALPLTQCDPAQIEQVLLALILNAIDAMPQGGNLWLSTQVERERQEVSVLVRDDGSGIAPEILPQIFEPFLTTKEGGHGVGLGLAISHSIVERHKGRIEVQSQTGKGTVFTVTLPYQESEPLALAQAVSAASKGR